jgi:cyclohexanone monooxygenase
MTPNATSTPPSPPQQYDALVVGAGFAGMFMLHRLRGLGLRVRVFESGADVGGTWYFNRYPGARCDAESLLYSYSFSEGVQREWKWTERYASQPEILAYLNFVADRLDLRPHIQFNSRISAATFDDATSSWTVSTAAGERATARYCIFATGCLSVSQVPRIEGLNQFKGPWYHTGSWPHEGVDFTGKRVGVIGTGSTGIQAIPMIAETAARLFVFQRTPNYSVPAVNGPIDPAFGALFDREVTHFRQRSREGTIFGGGDVAMTDTERSPIASSAFAVGEEERQREFERRWRHGGAQFLQAFPDLMTDVAANETAAQFVRTKIRSIVADPKVAALLTPTDYPLGAKRICVDTDYHATFNRPNVTLVDLKQTPIRTITPVGLRTSDSEYELDVIVFATGFDAMTGALLAVDVRGAGGLSLREEWSAGPRVYLGLCAAGFPNLFMITGPGSPSVLSNVVVSIEQHVEFVTDLLALMKQRHQTRIEADRQAQDAWVEHVNQVANATIFSKGESWYLGANVPGKPRVFMPYAGGVGAYRQICQRVAANDYEGFRFA